MYLICETCIEVTSLCTPTDWIGLIFQESCICFSIIIEELAMGYIKILSELKLVLPSIPFVSTHITGMWGVSFPFYFIYNFN